ncbi:universal stress protein [Cryobacterium psychrophilum]|uniref:Universal stress protein n=1 Tax=Cryobacterium psychrophilum TaxID=41988 RepID=A0A4Y8KMR7_9MICO|nr:universal stress protein [Cryobacterium psychrophilum]TDW29219.1 nucleotide-binding universal stress UspA family protein [Cryobacterium psychrophilum]TFD74664.1 universal stress protein [Cryobacterium psychrophilum]
MTSLLVGIDGSDSSRRAVAFACRLAEESGAAVHIVHVIPWSPYSFTTPAENDHRSASKAHEITAAEQQIMQPALAVAREFSVTPTSSVVHGSPADLLVSIGAHDTTSQIIVGRTGDSRIKQVLFGSTPVRLIQISKTPVTVVP